MIEYSMEVSMKKTKSKDILSDVETLKKNLEEYRKLEKEIKAIKQKLIEFAGDDNLIDVFGKWLIEIQDGFRTDLDKKKMIADKIDLTQYEKVTQFKKVMEPKPIK